MAKPQSDGPKKSKKLSGSESAKFSDAKKNRLRITRSPMDEQKKTWEVYVKHSPEKGKGSTGLRYPEPGQKPLDEVAAKTKFNELVTLAEKANWVRSAGGGERTSAFDTMPKAAVA